MKFTNIVLFGNLRTTVWWITEWYNGGGIHPHNICYNMGETVLDRGVSVKAPEFADFAIRET